MLRPRKQRKSYRILIILASDLVYGNVSCYGAKHFATPNIDRLANNWLRFTNGYGSSATCTPSQYAMLTGMYPWCSKAQILPGDAPLIIKPSKTTIQRMLQQAGLTIGVLGKWHLGLGGGNVDWNQQVMPGANETELNYSYIQASTNDRALCLSRKREVDRVGSFLSHLCQQSAKFYRTTNRAG